MKRPKLDHADWHITSRGARRLLLFHEATDFSTFYALLGESCRRTGVDLIADCLMSNHFHLALSGGTPAISSCMHRLNRTYSDYHNKKYALSGHAFDRVFFGAPIPSAFLLKRTIRYIHLNPVRGGMVDRPELYPWSSYRRLTEASVLSLGGGERRVLDLFCADPKQAQQQYRSFTEKDLCRRIVAPAGRTPAWEIWQEQFGWILDHMTDREEQLGSLDRELAAVYFGSRIGIPPRAMGRVLGYPSGQRVSELLRNLAKRLSRDPSLQSILDSLGVL